MLRFDAEEKERRVKRNVEKCLGERQINTSRKEIIAETVVRFNAEKEEEA